jgi:hypothetical protein
LSFGSRTSPNGCCPEAGPSASTGRPLPVSGSGSGSEAEGGVPSPPRRPQRRVAASESEDGGALPASRPAAVNAAELDFPAGPRCPPPHAIDGAPPEAIPPEVLDVIAVAIEIAIQRHRAGNAA